MPLNSIQNAKSIWSLMLFLCLCACASNNVVSPDPAMQNPNNTEGGAENGVAPSVEQQKQFESAASKALSFQKKGQYDKAIRRWLKISETYSAFDAVPLNLGICYLKLGDLDQASTQFSRALAIEANNVDTLIEQAYVMRLKGQLDNANTLYQQALEISPDNARLHFNFAVMNDLYLNQPQQALRFYQQFLDLSEDKNSGRVQQVKQWVLDLERRIKQDERNNAN